MYDHHKLTVRAIATFLLFALASLAWQGGEIPPTDDPDHKGQPIFCQNFDTREYKKNCACRAMNPDSPACKKKEDDYEPLNCSVRCRPKSCTCQRHCETE